MSVTVTFRTDTDPFSGRTEFEAAAVLQQVADQITEYADNSVDQPENPTGEILDDNGTVIGSWKLTRNEAADATRFTNPAPAGITPIPNPGPVAPPLVPLKRVDEAYVEFIVHKFTHGTPDERRDIVEVYADNFDPYLTMGNAHGVYIEELAWEDAANGPANYLFRRGFITRTRLTNTRLWSKIAPHMTTTI